jgi:hypothetical protein
MIQLYDRGAETGIDILYECGATFSQHMYEH